MCLAPITLQDRTQVACRHCEWCRSNRLNDLVGRCIAEQCTASSSYSVTLTYGGDGPESAILRYADVQLMLKRLRKDGYTVRYICAGEYGSKKGRAHWHIILFFYGRAPQIPIESRFDWSFWPHGFVYFQNPDYKGFRYVMKYALKQIDDKGAVKSLSMSKKPPLGYQFFMQLASDMVKRGLALYNPEYSFAHVRDHEGRPRKYWLQGRMAEMFCEEYCRLWRDAYAKEPLYTDWLYERYLDPIARKEMDLDPIRYERDRRLRDEAYLAGIRARAVDDMKTRRQEIGICLVSYGHSDILIAYSDQTAELYLGGNKWLITATVNGATVAAQLLRSGLPKSKVQPSVLWLEKLWRDHCPQS